MKNEFKKIVVVSLILLSTLIGIFTYLNLNSNPHIRKVEVIGGDSNAELVDQRIKVSFSRPIIKENIESAILINPVTNFKVSWIGNDLYILPNVNLDSETKYSLTFKKQITDIYNKQFTEDYFYEFTTRKQFITYISNNDEINRVDTDLENIETIYTGRNIMDYEKDNKYLVTIEENDDKSRKVYLIDLENNEKVSILNENQTAYDIKLSSKRNEIFILLQDYHFNDEFLIPDTGREIYSYKIDEEKLEKLDLNQDFIDIDEFNLSPNGDALLIKVSYESIYYLVDLNNLENITPLGKFVSSGGFRNNGMEIVFTSFDLLTTENPLVNVINNNREKSELTDGSIFTIDPVFMNTTDNIIYAEKYFDYENTKGAFQIVIQDREGNRIEEFSDLIRSLELPKPSYDDKYIVMEDYELNDLTDYENLRVYSFQSKPKRARIVVYDFKNDKFIDRDILGIEARWE